MVLARQSRAAESRGHGESISVPARRWPDQRHLTTLAVTLESLARMLGNKCRRHPAADTAANGGVKGPGAGDAQGRLGRAGICRGGQRVLIALQADDPTMARAGAVIPFAVLVVAMATAPRAAGWSFAAAGLVVTALCPMAAVSRTGGTGGWLFVACIVLASIMVTIAMIRAGAWRTMRRHTWIVALLGVFAGLVAITS